MKGCYLLVVELKNNTTINVGKLGKKQFDKGHYVYVGSALNGLAQRIQRHLRKQKKTHWHIDYLLKHAKIVDVFYKENVTMEECSIANKFSKFNSIEGFGCSDCKCKSHLFYGSIDDIANVAHNLEMRNFVK